MTDASSESASSRFSADGAAPPFQSSDGPSLRPKSLKERRFASGVFASCASVRPSSAEMVSNGLSASSASGEGADVGAGT